MAEHITTWLGAYHDGELRGARLKQVEEHLAACEACQAELAAMRSLSGLLRESAPEDEFVPADRFAANLVLRLPRRSEPVRPHPYRGAAWWLVPVSLLGAWVFIEITHSLSLAVELALRSGAFNGGLGWLQGAPLQMSWFATAMGLFGEQLGAPGQALLAVLNQANLVVARWVWGLLPQAVLAAGYLGWLLAWWLRRNESGGKWEVG